MDPLRLIIRRFDDWLSGLEGVQRFTDDPRVILRIQSSRLRWDIPLPQATIPRGAPALIIHLWNERVPAMPADGPDLNWARHTQRLMLHSFRSVAQYMVDGGMAHNVQAVGGHIAQIKRSGFNGGRLMFERLGFTIYRYHRSAGAFGEFWENFYTWWLMWTYNPASLRHRPLFSLQRNEFWMTTEKYLHKFAIT